MMLIVEFVKFELSPENLQKKNSLRKFLNILKMSAIPIGIKHAFSFKSLSKASSFLEKNMSTSEDDDNLNQI